MARRAVSLEDRLDLPVEGGDRRRGLASASLQADEGEDHEFSQPEQSEFPLRGQPDEPWLQNLQQDAYGCRHEKLAETNHLRIPLETVQTDAGVQRYRAAQDSQRTHKGSTCGLDRMAVVPGATTEP